MKFAETELRQIVQETWKIVLEDEPNSFERPVAPIKIQDCVAACTQITGDWQLAVVLYCASATARHAASVMFAVEECATSTEDIQDALCELVNIIGGNVKGILSGSSYLSLPNLVTGQNYELMFPRHIPLSEASFRYAGRPVVLRLLGEDKFGARAGGSSTRALKKS